jgi:hypothetical protein
MSNEHSNKHSLEDRLKRAASDLDRAADSYALQANRSAVKSRPSAVSRPRFAVTAGLAFVATIAVVIGVVRSPSKPTTAVVDVASGPTDSVLATGPALAPTTSSGTSATSVASSTVASEVELAVLPELPNQIEFAAATTSIKLIAATGESSSWFRARQNQLVRVSFVAPAQPLKSAPTSLSDIKDPKLSGSGNSTGTPSKSVSKSVSKSGAESGSEGANAQVNGGVTISVADRGIDNGLIAELSSNGTIRLPSTGEFVLTVVNRTGSELVVNFSIEG